MSSVVNSSLRFLRDLMREPLLAMWGLYILLLPVRLVPSGYPQPSDALSVMLFVAALRRWKGRMPATMLQPFRALLWFTLWVTLVDIFWCVVTWEWGVNALNVLYYVYNAMVFFTVLMLYQRYGDRFLRVTLYALFTVTLLQVAASFLIHFGKTRTSLFFNNSNQLGYYSLLTACLISVMHRRLRFGLPKSAAALTACAYLALLSASRSALIGIAVLLVLLVFTNPRVIVLGVVVALGLGFVAQGDSTFSHAIDESQRRMTEDRDPERNFFEERGYDRIWNNAEYLFTGAGEGHAERFAEEGSSRIEGLEIHSSAGTIVFCYGIIGVGLIAMFLYRLVRGADRRLALMLVPIMLHSLAHQGLRFSLLWITLAVFLVVKLRPKPQTSTVLMTSPSRI